jgi:hypothetical protein
MTKTRNFALHITDDQKANLKRLAAASNITLTRYIEEVLNEAVAQGDLFEVKAHKVASPEKTRTAIAARSHR